MAKRYSLVCKLISKTSSSVSAVTQNLISSGDLTPYLNRLEYNNVGIDTQNNATITLDVPPDGTFVRRAPILVDKEAKHSYLIDIQITSDGNAGKLFRGQLGQVSITVDENGGEMITIPLIGLEYVLQEMFDGRHDRFKTPKERFTNLLTSIVANKGSSGTNFGYSNIDLPSDTSLKQIWTPNGLSSYHELLSEVIKKLEDPPATGGTLTDYYFDYSPSSSTTRHIDVHAEAFGNTSSGVTLDPVSVTPSGSEDDQTAITDNILYKNNIIVKGASNGGSLPTEYSKFASNYLHGMARNLHSQTPYSKGDKVKTEHSTFPQTRFWTSKVDQGSLPIPVPQTNRATADNFWQEDFTIDPNYSVNSNNNTDAAYFSYTPWTAGKLHSTGSYGNIASFKQNLVGLNGIPSNVTAADESTVHSWVGFMVDWNIARTNWARDNPEDPYEQVSVKYVSGFKTASELNAIRNTRVNDYDSSPASSRAVNNGCYDGNRFIVNDNNSFTIGAYTSTGAYTTQSVSNKKNCIVEWDGNFGTLGEWRISNFPTQDTSGSGEITTRRDVINNLDDGKVYKFNGTTNTGSWQMAWEATSDSGMKNFGTPFHLADNIQLISGATGIEKSAVEVQYDWRTALHNWMFNDILDNSGVDRNLSSRGAWLNMWFPHPKNESAHPNEGSQSSAYQAGQDYGGNNSYPYIRASNMNSDKNGLVGWNSGLNSEDMGEINGVHFKIRLGLFSQITNQYASNESKSTIFAADFPMVFWAMDKFDRIVFQEFTCRVNDQWQDVTLPFGNNSGMELFVSRIDEAVKAGDFILPFDFTIKEREFTGVAFDWRFVKCVGWFYKENYSTDVGYYNGNAESAVDSVTEWFSQSWEKGVDSFVKSLNRRQSTPVMQDDGTYVAKLDIDSFDNSAKVTAFSRLAIDEFHFVKDLYVTTNRTTTSIADPRVELIRREDEQDYNNALAVGNAVLARRKFFPQEWHVRALGDARIQLGKALTITGDRVPYNESDQQTMNLVCSGIKHIIDSDGYYVEVDGIRKFVLESGDTDQP